MSITVHDFKYIAGQNDAEYIKLLEKELNAQKKLTSKAIAKLKEKQVWIPCSKRMPEDFEKVLVCFSDGAIDVANRTDYIDILGNVKWCHANSDWFHSGAVSEEDIVAWMPLPQSYKEKNNE